MDFNDEPALASLQETQGDRIMRALRKIFEKMNSLEKKTERRRKRVQNLEIKHCDQVSADEFYRRLASAEARCQLLEEQLLYVRKFIAEPTLDSQPMDSRDLSTSNGEMSPLDDIPTKIPSTISHTSKAPNEHDFIPSSLKDGSIRDFLQQNSTASKLLKDLSHQIPKRNEIEERQYMQDIAAGTNGFSSKRRAIEKRQIEHYHVNVKGMPFVSATTSSKSHSLRANIQTLCSMVKYCNPVLCSAAPHSTRRALSAERQSSKRDTQPRRQRSNSLSEVSKPFHSLGSSYPEMDNKECKCVRGSRERQKSCGCKMRGIYCVRCEMKRTPCYCRRKDSEESNMFNLEGVRHSRTLSKNSDIHKRKLLLQNLKDFQFYLHQAN